VSKNCEKTKREFHANGTYSGEKPQKDVRVRENCVAREKDFLGRRKEFATSEVEKGVRGN